MRLPFDKILVTGGAGFIGSHTVDALLENGSEVWVLDNLTSGFLNNLRRWKGFPELHFIRGDIRQHGLLNGLARKVDAIVHLAALVSIDVSIRRPDLTNQVNVVGTLNVLRSAVKHKVMKVVVASSSSVYGDVGRKGLSEVMPLNPTNPYGVSKLAAEKYTQIFHRTYGLRTVSLRYLNVYGERQSSNPYSGVIAIFANRLMIGKRPVIYGDASQTRDFIHVSDVVKANLLALKTERGIGESFNIGTGHATSIIQLYRLLAHLTGKTRLTPVFRPSRTGDIKHSCARTSKARSNLGFEAKVTLEEGLRSLVTQMQMR